MHLKTPCPGQAQVSDSSSFDKSLKADNLCSAGISSFFSKGNPWVVPNGPTEGIKTRFADPRLRVDHGGNTVQLANLEPLALYSRERLAPEPGSEIGPARAEWEKINEPRIIRLLCREAYRCLPRFLSVRREMKSLFSTSETGSPPGLHHERDQFVLLLSNNLSRCWVCCLEGRDVIARARWWTRSVAALSSRALL